MNTTKIKVPTITLAMITSQMFGCASVTQEQLKKMLEHGDSIEIEVAKPISKSAGIEKQLEWYELASIPYNSEFRNEWEFILGTEYSGTIKVGDLYTNEKSHSDQNNTLQNVMHNKKMISAFNDNDIVEKLIGVVEDTYADIESNKKKLLMGINGFFNILPDSEPNFANPDKLVTRAEFMSMVYRASHKVDELDISSDFVSAVGDSQYTLYAQNENKYAYINTRDLSLNQTTYKSPITRIEAIYILAKQFLSSIKPEEVTFDDCSGIVEPAREIEHSEYGHSAILSIAINDETGSLPSDLYKALEIGYGRIFNDTYTDWKSGVTRSLAIEFIINTFKSQEDKLY